MVSLSFTYYIASMIVGAKTVARVNLFSFWVGNQPLELRYHPANRKIRPVVVAENMIGCAMYELV